MVTADEEGGVYYIPAIKPFEDTGPVQHKFASGSCVQAKVVPSQDYSEGADIELYIKGSEGSVVCRAILDKFAALCLADSIIRTLTNQEELVHDARKRSIINKNRRKQPN